MKKSHRRSTGARNRAGKLTHAEAEGLEIQVAALPIRRKDGSHQVLMVTSSNREWILPKGRRNPRLTDAEAAAREALEEAGVSGTINPQALGTYVHRQANGNRKRVIVFELPVDRVSRRWQEKHKRKRGWMPLDEAYWATKQVGLRRLLHKLQSRHATATDP